jgi:LacI family transcriptional regulator
MSRTKTRITIYDVAERAGVAISTVSRVLNQSPEVAEPTRIRVELAIEDLQYRPDRTARSLAQQEYNSLAVALPSFTAPFQNELLKGIRTVLREHALDLLICDLGSSQPERALVDFLQRGAVRGLLLCGVPVSESVRRELMTMHSPTVLIGHESDGFDAFRWDDAAGARQAVRHLLQEGHEHIAMIRANGDGALQRERISGYRAALEEHGRTVDESLIVMGHIGKHGGFSEEDGYDAMERLLADRPDVTAVFASSDVQAIGALAALNDRGLSAPDDVAIVGYDDIKTSRYIGLSSVDQSMQKIGFSATERLLARISGQEPGPVKTVVVSPTLNIRRTSRKTA